MAVHFLWSSPRWLPSPSLKLPGILIFKTAWYLDFYNAFGPFYSSQTGFTMEGMERFQEQKKMNSESQFTFRV